MQPIASPSEGSGAGDRARAAPAGQHKQALGRQGEELAAAHLERAGLSVLARNWRCRAGEIDIVAADGPVVVGCEVKTRRGRAFGPPEEGVDRQKLARLYRLINQWAADNGRRPCRVRVDVVGVLLLPGAGPRIDHLVGVC